MSETIDQRVLEMQFNNKDFEKDIKTSMTSLDNLKKGLNMKGAIQNVSNLSRVFSAFSLRGINNGVSTLTSRFSMMGIAGMAVIQRLTGSIMNMTKQMLDSVTGLAAMKSGFQEYETQINAIQTIQANTAAKGTTLDDISGALDQLNTYADKTIYNFTEMTRNIGTFTAAGVDLDTSVAAIKGIANLAAVSGSTSQQASTGMYQLSQALSSGTVRLQDWNSVVNAGMGGEVFKNSLMETAKNHDVAIDSMIKSEGSFRNTLQKGWLSKEILLETLSKFTGDLNAEALIGLGYNEEQIEGILALGQTANDAATKVKTFTQLKETLNETAQSGWTKTWQLILGDFGEAKELFTGISELLGPMIEATATSRNNLLEAWNGEGGRDAMITNLLYAFKQLSKVVGIVKEAFEEIFPPMTASQIIDIQVAINKLVRHFWLSRKALLPLKRTLKGVFAVFDIFRMAIVAVAKAVWGMITALAPAGKSFLDITANAGDFLVTLRDNIKETDFFGTALANAGTFVVEVKDKIVEFAEKVKTAYHDVRDFVINLKDKFSEFKDEAKEAFQPLIDIFDDLKEKLGELDTSKLTNFFDKLKERFAILPGLKKIFAASAGGIWTLVKKMLPGFFKFADGVAEGMGGFSDAILDAIDNLEFNNIVDLFNSGLLAALLLGFKNFLDGGSDVFENVGDILDGLGDSLQAMQTNLKADALLKIAGAVALLALSAVALSLVDSAKLAASVGVITVMFADLLGSLALFDKMSGNMKGTMKVVAVILAISVSILVLAFALSLLAKLDFGELAVGMAGLVGITALLVGASKIMAKSSGDMIKAGVGITALSFGILILTFALKSMGKMDLASLGKGMGGLAGIFVMIGVFIKTLGDSKGLIKAAVGMILLSGAIGLMVISVKALGEMSLEELAKGLGSIAVMLALFVAFMRTVPKDAGVKALSLIGLSVAVYILGQALTTMGALSLEQMAIGLGGMTVALAAMIGALYLIPKDAAIKAAGMVVMATAIVILSEALTTMGGMSLAEMAIGVGGMAASLAVLAGGLYLMQGATGGIAAMMAAAIAVSILAPALKTLGSMSLEEIGLAMLALVGMFGILAAAGYLLAPVIPVILSLAGAMALFGLACLAVGAGVTLFAAGLTALSIAGTAGVATLVLLITSIIGLLPMIVEQVGLVLIALIQALILAMPALLELVKLILLGVIDVLVSIIPPLLDGLALILVSLLEFLIVVTPQLVEAAFTLLMAFLTGIRDNIAEVVIVAGEIIIAFLDAMGATAPDIIEQAFETMITFIEGMTAAVEEHLPELIDAGAEMALAVINGMIDGLGGEAVESLKTKIFGIAKNAWGAFKAALGIESPSKVARADAKYIPEGAALGIGDGEHYLVEATESMADKAVTGLKKAMSTISNVVDADMDMYPTITPVLDLSELLDGTTTMDGILGGTHGLDLSGTAALAASAFTESNVDDTANANGSTGNNGSITLTQINNSPKALSRLDIYRDTRNQLNTLKGLVNS